MVRRAYYIIIGERKKSKTWYKLTNTIQSTSKYERNPIADEIFTGSDKIQESIANDSPRGRHVTAKRWPRGTRADRTAETREVEGAWRSTPIFFFLYFSLFFEIFLYFLWVIFFFLYGGEIYCLWYSVLSAGNKQSYRVPFKLEIRQTYLLKLNSVN